MEMTLESLKAETQKYIDQAKDQMDKYYDYHLANFILRDIKIVKGNEGLHDLIWTGHNSGNLSKNDVLGVIAHIERVLAEPQYYCDRHHEPWFIGGQGKVTDHLMEQHGDELHGKDEFIEFEEAYVFELE